MGKKKIETVEEAETNKSIGSTVKSKLTQRDRNLAVKAEMIAKGVRPAAKPGALRTQRERNLYLKAGKPDGTKAKK